MTCNECGTPNFSGTCATCITMRQIRILDTALDWTRPAIYPREVKRDE